MHPTPDDQELVARMRTAHQHAREALNVRAAHDHLHQEAWGWHGRTLSQPVTSSDRDGWLRLASAPTGQVAHTFWTGALDAEAALPDDLPRPRLRRHHDWTESPWQYRAELYERMPAGPIANTMFPEHVPNLALDWWSGLRTALTKVAAVRTTRRTVQPSYLNAAIPRTLGTQINTAAAPWETAHGDLHWANLYSPLRIVDWEGWGLAPIGYDAAMLHTHSLLHPPTAARIRSAFPILDTLAGHRAQLITITELLEATPHDLHIARTLHAHAVELARSIGPAARIC